MPREPRTMLDHRGLDGFVGVPGGPGARAIGARIRSNHVYPRVAAFCCGSTILGWDMITAYTEHFVEAGGS